LAVKRKRRKILWEEKKGDLGPREGEDAGERGKRKMGSLPNKGRTGVWGGEKPVPQN